jgi:hypothetical protein
MPKLWWKGNSANLMRQEEKRVIATVNRRAWDRMLRLSGELDLNKGGYYDGRSGCINLWCGPEDKPESWKDIDITKGALNFPRSYIGCIDAEFINDDTIEIQVSVIPYERAEEEVAQHYYGMTRIEAILAKKHILFNGRKEEFMTPLPDEWEWVENKARELVAKCNYIMEGGKLNKG